MRYVKFITKIYSKKYILEYISCIWKNLFQKSYFETSVPEIFVPRIPFSSQINNSMSHLQE